MALPNRAHRLMVGANVGVPHRWTVVDIGDIDPSTLTQADVGKLARVEQPPTEEGGWAPHVSLYFLSALDDSGLPENPPNPDWKRLAVDASWVTWTVVEYEELDAITVTAEDLHKIALVESQPGYYVLAGVGEGSVWLRLDNVDPSAVLPIAWVIDPEGYPASIAALVLAPEDVHKIAYDPSRTSHYWILRELTPDGLGGYDPPVWVALDTPAVDITGKVDRVAERLDIGGTAYALSESSFLEKMLVTSSASAVTITLHSDVSAPGISAVQSVPILQGGAGSVSFVAGAGATVYPPGALTIAGQWRLAHATKIAPDTWLVSGDLT